VDIPRLYTDLADWWPLLSPPEEYAEEAATYTRLLVESAQGPLETVLELGSGGGSNASHMKRHFTMTLVDPAEGMLAHSRRLNPECEHLPGDMRTVRLGRRFDAVFVHDAVAYMTSEADVRAAIETAAIHCRPGGAVLFAPDHIRENFVSDTDHGGHDGDGRGIRYLEWTWDPDPSDRTYVVDYAYLLREPGGTVRVVHDRHVEGLFSRTEWLRWLSEAGFRPQAVPVAHAELDPGRHEVFLGTRYGTVLPPRKL